MGRDEFDARMQIQLPLVLASVAGSVDVIGLVSFKLFTAHITGNLVLIADQLVRAGPPKVDEVLAVPVFITAVAAVWLIAKLSGRKGPGLVRLLLVLHLLMLTVVWVLSLLEHPALDRKQRRFLSSAP